MDAWETNVMIKSLLNAMSLWGCFRDATGDKNGIKPKLGHNKDTRRQSESLNIIETREEVTIRSI